MANRIMPQNRYSKKWWDALIPLNSNFGLFLFLFRRLTTPAFPSIWRVNAALNALLIWEREARALKYYMGERIPE